MVSRISRFLMPEDQNQIKYTGTTESTRAEYSLPSPSTPGFALASPPALKLLIAFRHLAAAGRHSGSHAEIAALAGLSSRAVASALNDLIALEWVRAISGRTLGIAFILLEPPTILSPAAAQRFSKKIATSRVPGDSED